MNKIQMAHEMALAIQGTKLLHDMELVSDMAWKYADAMQAEADEREKEIKNNQLKTYAEAYMNCEIQVTDPDGNCRITTRQKELDKKEWQPDWSQAPEWSNWWSADENGTANFSGKKPHIEGHQWVYYSAAGEKPCHIEAPSFNYQGNWKNSLRKRPQ